MTRPERESRPVGGTTEPATSISTAIKTRPSVVVRCSNCGHLIHAAESLAAGLGRDCRRALRRTA
ncbi:DUF6011 domain-containing protein [Nocardioides dongxiaopingii]|uniref:DUF6011 domain-containing protein n=1 Tax=Nocardioides dongxiaopingii TaxID=2576036 RepID=UPI003CCC47A6